MIPANGTDPNGVYRNNPNRLPCTALFYEETMAESTIAEAGGHWAGVVPRGETLTIFELKGDGALIFFTTTLISRRRRSTCRHLNSGATAEIDDPHQS